MKAGRWWLQGWESHVASKIQTEIMSRWKWCRMPECAQDAEITAWCPVCGCPCDTDIHAAVLAVRAWHRTVVCPPVFIVPASRKPRSDQEEWGRHGTEGGKAGAAAKRKAKKAEEVTDG